MELNALNHGSAINVSYSVFLNNMDTELDQWWKRATIHFFLILKKDGTSHCFSGHNVTSWWGNYSSTGSAWWEDNLDGKAADLNKEMFWILNTRILWSHLFTETGLQEKTVEMLLWHCGAVITTPRKRFSCLVGAFLCGLWMFSLGTLVSSYTPKTFQVNGF